MVDICPETPPPLETEHKDLAKHGTPKSPKFVPFSSLDTIIRPRPFSSITSAPSQQPQTHFSPRSIPTIARHDPTFNPPNLVTRINDWELFLQKPDRKLQNTFDANPFPSNQNLFPKTEPTPIKFIDTRIPPFDSDDIKIWFKIFEANLHQYLENDETTYNALLGRLGCKHIRHINYVLDHPNPTYTMLKTALLKTYDIPQSTRWELLKKSSPIGDRRPFELMADLKSIYGAFKTEEDTARFILLNEFYARLPEHVSAILKMFDKAETLEEISLRADKIFEQQQPAAKTSPSSTFTHSKISNEELSAKIDSLMAEMKSMGLQQQTVIHQPPPKFFLPSDYSFSQASRPSSQLSQYGAKPNFNNRRSNKQTLAFTNPNHNSKRSLGTASSINSSRVPTHSSTPASFQPFLSKANPPTQAHNKFN